MLGLVKIMELQEKLLENCSKEGYMWSDCCGKRVNMLKRKEGFVGRMEISK